MSWELKTQQAALVSNDWRVELVPTEPMSGLKVFHQGVELGTVLCVIPQPTHSRHIQEAYVRQADLIVRYEQHGDDLYTLQLNWRTFDCDLDGALAIELWLSVQTTLLDTHPVVELKSSVNASNWETVSLRERKAEPSERPAVMVAHCGQHTLLVMVQASDVEHVALQSDDLDTEHTLRMFGHFMEKGVIRRARVCFVAAPQPLDDAAIQNVYQQFSDSPLPLTA